MLLLMQLLPGTQDHHVRVKYQVTSDNVNGARRAAEFLIKGGHKRIAHVMGWQGSSTGRDRAEGFKQAMQAAGSRHDYSH